MAFDFDGYQKTFNSGDDDGAMEYWEDDLSATFPISPTQVVEVASNKEEFRQFLAAAHNGIREVMRLQSYLESDTQIFAEFDMDFWASKDRPDFDQGALKAGEFLTVKMFGLYTLRNGRLWKMRMAFWPANQGVSEPPSYQLGIAPPEFTGVRAQY